MLRYLLLFSGLLHSAALGQDLGPWRGVLDCPGGEIAFEMQLEREQGQLRLWLINGVERKKVERVSADGPEFLAHLDPYDSRLVARLAADGRSMQGRWIRYRSEQKTIELPFRAQAGQLPRYTPGPVKGGNQEPSLASDLFAGRWRVDFSSSADPAVGIFTGTGDGTGMHGTFLTTLGDYRFLAGIADARGLQLSVFDGAHAFLFKATHKADGTLSGEFWSRDSWHET